MDAGEFEKAVLDSFRGSFPTLYATHIKGRKRAFVNEHLPLTTLASLAGEVIGKVPLSARIVWALADLLRGHVGKVWDWNHFPETRSELWLGIEDSTGVMMLAMLELGFWESCIQEFQLFKGSEELWIVNSNWDVTVVQKSTPLSQGMVLDKLQRISCAITGTAVTRRCVDHLMRT